MMEGTVPAHGVPALMKPAVQWGKGLQLSTWLCNYSVRSQEGSTVSMGQRGTGTDHMTHFAAVVT